MDTQYRRNKDITKEEKDALIAQFSKSGLSHMDFAKEHNVNRITFRNWLWAKDSPGSLGKRYSPTERKKAVEAFMASELSASEFSELWGVSPGAIIGWTSRYKEDGADGLMTRKRKIGDKRLGMKVHQSVQDEIVGIKKAEPSFGFKKIKNWMFRHKGMKVSTGTIRKTVKNEGLPLAIKPRKKKRSSEKVRRFERARPMQLWQSDITQFTVGPASMRVYLTVFMDDHSRYIVGWRLQSRQTADLVMDAFKDAAVRFGKPEEVLTDQGRQYFAWRGKSDLEKYLEKEGIKHVVSRAHHPQTLGKCERFWETIGNEFWTRARPQDLEEARERLKYFIDHYNHQRPHQGIDGMTPADRFFGVAEEVREIIERTITENSLRLAIGELPKAPAFLIGQIGDQKISFHGSSGKFILTNENLNGEENGTGIINSNRTSVRDYAISNRANSITQEARQEARFQNPSSEVTGSVPSDTGAGFMGSGDGGRAWTSETNIGEDNGIMAGPNNEGGCDAGIKYEADSFLANEQSGNGRDACRVIDPTTYQVATEGEWNDRARRDQYAEEEGS